MSMDCARVVRGTSSSANSVAPVPATAFTSSGRANGATEPTTTWPARRRDRSPLAGSASITFTCTSTSAAKTSSRLPVRAPRSVNAASGYPARSPAPDSITTSKPALVSWGSAVGESATRVSPARFSRGTPTTMRGVSVVAISLFRSVPYPERARRASPGEALSR